MTGCSVPLIPYTFERIAAMRGWTAFKRSAAIVGLFVRIFLSFYLLRYQKLWHPKGWARKRQTELFVIQARRFRETALSLGGLLIKLGQFFSSRVDLLPRLSLNELEKLQDEVNPAPYEDIKQVVEAEFGLPLAEVFPGFSIIPEASASLGQVHQATLADGRLAAVKVQRPGIEEIINIDLLAIKKVVRLIQLFTDWEKYADFDFLYEDFASTLRAELDYIEEGRNAERIGSNMKKNRHVQVPGIIWEYTRRRVLTMEYMSGIKINDFAAFEKAGINRQLVARHLLRIYVSQVLVDGFFHADPHPGNLFVTEKSDIIMVDFGMVGQIPPQQREMMLDVASQILDRDYGEVVVILKKMGFLAEDVDEELMSRAITAFIDQFINSQPDLTRADLRMLLDDLEEFLYEFPFRMPSNMTFLGRALGTLYGLCLSLDPEINFIQEAEPFLREATRQHISPMQFIGSKLIRLAGTVLGLPLLAERVYKKADEGSIRVRIPMKEINRSLGANTRAIRLLAWSIAFAGAAAVSAYLLVHGHLAAAWVAGGASLLSLVIMAVTGLGLRRLPVQHPDYLTRRRDSG